jgi:hypothetical protein
MSEESKKSIPCGGSECEAHIFVIDLVKELQISYARLTEGQMDIKENLIRLTENLLETQRSTARFELLVAELKTRDKEQDVKIESNRDFMNKAIGVVGSVSFLATIVSAVAVLITYLVT